MIKIITAITVDNPNDSEDNFITIKLIPTEQEVKAIYVNPITLDTNEQKPNIKIGSEVACIFDDETYAFYVIGTIQQSNKPISEKKYIVENSDEVDILTDILLKIESISGGKIVDVSLQAENITIDNDKYIQTTSGTHSLTVDKIEVKNSANELISVLSELISELIALQCIGNLGVPALLAPPTIAKLTAVQVKLDTFKA